MWAWATQRLGSQWENRRAHSTTTPGGPSGYGRREVAHTHTHTHEQRDLGHTYMWPHTCSQTYSDPGDPVPKLTVTTEAEVVPWSAPVPHSHCQVPAPKNSKSQSCRLTDADSHPSHPHPQGPGPCSLRAAPVRLKGHKGPPHLSKFSTARFSSLSLSHTHPKKKRGDRRGGQAGEGVLVAESVLRSSGAQQLW